MKNLLKALHAAVASMGDPKKNAKKRPCRHDGSPKCRCGSAMDRFTRRASVYGVMDCWPWVGLLTPNGYGTFSLGGSKSTYAHRFSYESFVGPIHDGLVVDHVCENRRCVNPLHLRLLTIGANVMASTKTTTRINADKTACPRCGSSFTTDILGRRFCRACSNRAATRRYAEMKASDSERYRRALDYQKQYRAHKKEER